MFTIGDKAPEFELAGYLKGETKNFKSSNFRNRWLVVFFYQNDFTPICASEMIALKEAQEEFKKEGAEVVGISGDSVFAHEVWSKELGELNFPLLADANKRVAHQFGALNEVEGVSRRATFILDSEGIIRHISLNPGSAGRNISEIIRLISVLQGGKPAMAHLDTRPEVAV